MRVVDCGCFAWLDSVLTSHHTRADWFANRTRRPTSLALALALAETKMDIHVHAETYSFGDAVLSSTPCESTQSLSPRLRLLAHSQSDSLSDSQVDVPRAEEKASTPRLDQSTAPSKDAERLPCSMRALLASAFIHSIGLGLVTVATPQMELSLFSDDASHAAAVNSVINPIAGVIGFFCTLLWSSLSDMYGRKLFLLLSLLGSACGLLVVGVTYNLLGLVLSRLIPAMFDVSNSVTYAVVSDVIPPERFVRTYAVFAAALGGGLLCGPLLGLAVMQIERDRLPWLVCASLTGLNWLWLARQLPETLRWRERVEQAKTAAAAEAAAPPPPLDTALQVDALSEAGELLAHAAIAADATPHPSAVCPSAELQSPAASPLAGIAPPRSREVREEIRPVPFERPPALRPLEFIQVAALRPFRHVSIIWSTHTLLRLNISLLLHSMSDGFLVTVVFLYTKVQWGWGTELNSALLVYAGILSLLTMLFIQPRLTRCFGEARMMQLAQAATMLQQLVVALPLRLECIRHMYHLRDQLPLDTHTTSADFKAGAAESAGGIAGELGRPHSTGAQRRLPLSTAAHLAAAFAPVCLSLVNTCLGRGVMRVHPRQHLVFGCCERHL